MTETLQKGRLVKVTMEIALPAAATRDEVDAWLRFEIGRTGGLPLENPLQHFKPEPFGWLGFDWEDTGQVGRIEEFDHQPTENGGQRFKRRHIREAAQERDSTMPRTPAFHMDFNRLDEDETEVTVEYTYSPGSPAFTPRGEYAPIDPPEGPEVEIVGACLTAGFDRLATRIAVNLTDAEIERFRDYIAKNHEEPKREED